MFEIGIDSPESSMCLLNCLHSFPGSTVTKHEFEGSKPIETYTFMHVSLGPEMKAKVSVGLACSQACREYLFSSS